MSARKQRGKTQKIFLIECTDIYKYSRSYMVCGTTKNVYKVTIKNIPMCTCPDNQMRRRRCKHIYFVLCRIMNVSSHRLEDSKKYSNKDLLKMFSNIPLVTNNLIVNNDTQKKYVKYKKNGNFTIEVLKIKKQRLDDICPICLDNIKKKSGEQLEYCKYSCGKSVHKICFERWINITHAEKKCVFCRADWEPKKYISKSQYINLNIQ